MGNSAKNNVNLTGAAAGDFLDGGRPQTEGTLIEIHHAQKRGGKTLVGDITIHNFGGGAAVDSKFRELRTRKGRRLSVVEADRLVGERHHLFRLNGFVVASVGAEASPETNQESTSRELPKQRAKAPARPATESLSSESISAAEISVAEISTDLDALEDAASEGQRQFVTHLRIERNQAKAEEAKRSYRARCAATGEQPGCQACHDNFADKYGIDYLEAHHKTPLSKAKGPIKTTVDDFDLLCANCHRAIHRMPQPAVITDLQQLLRERGFGA